MSMIETGTYGAKVQSWRTANPRDLLKRLIDAAPGAGEAELLGEFQQRVAADDDMIGAIVAYWFANNYRSLVRPEAVARPARIAAKHVAVEAVKGKVTHAIERRARAILLDMELPNGKALRDCTGAECTKLGGKVGKWLAAIGKAVKPGQKVGAAMSESQVRKLYSAA